MSGFSGIDDLITQITTNGKKLAQPFNRVVNTGATSVAGRCHEAFAGGVGGTGGVGVLTGTAGQGIAFTRSSPGAIPLNSGVTPATRHLLNGFVFTGAATAVPGIVHLIDLLYAYPSCVVTGAPTTLAQTAAKPTRFGTGAGVQAICIVAGTAIGAAQPILTVSYTEAGGTPPAGRTTRFAASANSQPIGSLLTASAVAGVLSGPYGHWDAGQTGIAQLDSYTLASGTTGNVCFALVRPIASFPIPAVGIAGERDFLAGTPTLPQIDDDACLTFLVQPGGALVANQVISGELVYGWN